MKSAAILAGMLMMGGASRMPAAQPDPAAAPAEQLDELETVLVIGEQPGPGLWKVSKGDHVMWVLAAYGPLPKGLIWRQQRVEARIMESQEVLYAPDVEVRPNIGLLRGITLIPAALKAAKIPDNKTLKDVVPAQTYSRWRALGQKYLVKNDDMEKAEKFRPALALESLRSVAFSKSGMQDGPDVYAFVGGVRKKHKIPGRHLPDVERTIDVENPRGMLKSAQKLQLPDIECFTSGLEKIEPDIVRARTLANAWARGDVEKLRSLHRNVRIKDAIHESCSYTLMAAINEGDSKDAAHTRKMLADTEWHLEQAIVQAQRDWVAAARIALDKNKSTFAVLNVAQVFSPDGHLQKLRELGYTVEEPL